MGVLRYGIGSSPGRAKRVSHRRNHPVPIDRTAFAGYRFPPEVIMLAVRWYLRWHALRFTRRGFRAANSPGPAPVGPVENSESPGQRVALVGVGNGFGRFGNAAGAVIDAIVRRSHKRVGIRGRVALTGIG